MSGNSGNKKGIGPGGGVVGGASGSGRSLKGHPPSGDFIALGNKPPARQGSPSIVGPPTKKPHVEEEDASEALFSNPIRISQAARPGGGGTSSDVTMTSSSKLSSTQPIDVRVSELVPSVNEALETKNTSKAIRLVLGGIKLLKNARLKADFKLNESLTTLVLNKPELFSNTSAVIELYIDDAIGDRTWIDLKSCKKLTDNIATLFNTQQLERVSDTDVPEQSNLFEFASKVWNYLQTIPPGKTVTYGGNVASAIGNSKSARAVGQVMKRNKLSILRPCHRVVCSNGSIGHYSSCNGTETKLWLLKHEEKNKELL